MKNTLLLLAVALLSACGSDGPPKKPTSLQSFYFSYADFIEPQVYKYMTNDNYEDLVYWHMQTEVVNGDTFFTTILYSSELDPTEKTVEKIDNEGAKLVSYVRFDEEGEELEARVLEDEVFIWGQKERSKIKWSIEFTYDGYKEEVTKTRQFRGFEDEYDFSSIKFKDDYLIKYTLEDTVLFNSFYQFSYYAPRVGLMNYDRFVPESPSIEGRSLGKYTEEEWLEKLGDKGF